MTTIKRTQITINSTNFDSNYIDFRGASGWYAGERHLPTKQCFIHVWQRSHNLPEFYENMTELYITWKKRKGTRAGWHLGLDSSFVTRSTNKFRSKGVKLKKLPTANDWCTLARLAEKSLVR